MSRHYSSELRAVAAQQTRARGLDAAQQELREVGYHAMTISGLARRAGRAGFTTRIRLADSQTVTAIAELSDGSFWSQTAEVIVTWPACPRTHPHDGPHDSSTSRPGSQARPDHRDQDADFSTTWNRFRRTARARHPARHHHGFVCNYNGEEFFRADLLPAIAANPFFAFSTVATETGNIDFRMDGDNGFSASASRKITVE